MKIVIAGVPEKCFYTKKDQTRLLMFFFDEDKTAEQMCDRVHRQCRCICDAATYESGNANLLAYTSTSVSTNIYIENSKIIIDKVYSKPFRAKLFFNEFNGHSSILAEKNTVLDCRSIPPHPHVWTEVVNLKLEGVLLDTHLWEYNASAIKFFQ